MECSKISLHEDGDERPIQDAMSAIYSKIRDALLCSPAGLSWAEIRQYTTSFEVQPVPVTFMHHLKHCIHVGCSIHALTSKLLGKRLNMLSFNNVYRIQSSTEVSTSLSLGLGKSCRKGAAVAAFSSEAGWPPNWHLRSPVAVE